MFNKKYLKTENYLYSIVIFLASILALTILILPIVLIVIYTQTNILTFDQAAKIAYSKAVEECVIIERPSDTASCTHLERVVSDSYDNGGYEEWDWWEFTFNNGYQPNDPHYFSTTIYLDLTGKETPLEDLV